MTTWGNVLRVDANIFNGINPQSLRWRDRGVFACADPNVLRVALIPTWRTGILEETGVKVAYLGANRRESYKT
jgi:hypothetical protein